MAKECKWDYDEWFSSDEGRQVITDMLDRFGSEGASVKDKEPSDLAAAVWQEFPKSLPWLPKKLIKNCSDSDKAKALMSQLIELDEDDSLNTRLFCAFLFLIKSGVCSISFPFSGGSDEINIQGAPSFEVRAGVKKLKDDIYERRFADFAGITIEHLFWSEMDISGAGDGNIWETTWLVDMESVFSIGYDEPIYDECEE